MSTTKPKKSVSETQVSESVAHTASSTKKPKKTPVTQVTGKVKKPPVAETVLKQEEKKAVKKIKPDKAKVVRDSFSFPAADYIKISELKKTCLANGVHVKKSEILRAGLHLLSKLKVDELKQTVEAIEKVQTGRPNKSKI